MLIITTLKAFVQPFHPLCRIGPGQGTISLALQDRQRATQCRNPAHDSLTALSTWQ
jgi:hypothetical protein